MARFVFIVAIAGMALKYVCACSKRFSVGQHVCILLLLLRSFIGGVAYVTVFNSSATWAAHSVFGGTSACWLFSSCHNPLNSDMDYRIFNVRTWSFVCLHRRRGVGHIDSESAQPFWLGKTVFLVLLTGFQSSTFGSAVRRSNHWANPSPQVGIHNLYAHAVLSDTEEALWWGAAAPRLADHAGAGQKGHGSTGSAGEGRSPWIFRHKWSPGNSTADVSAGLYM